MPCKFRIIPLMQRQSEFSPRQVCLFKNVCTSVRVVKYVNIFPWNYFLLSHDCGVCEFFFCVFSHSLVDFDVHLREILVKKRKWSSKSGSFFPATFGQKRRGGGTRSACAEKSPNGQGPSCHRSTKTPEQDGLKSTATGPTSRVL